jgi:hypothetical protein
MNTNIRNDVTGAVQRFSPISLAQMDTVSFMRRMDTKYVLNIEKLPELLAWASGNYDIFEINGIREQAYATTYFDTPDYSMYKQHHSGKLNRHKIRTRTYLTTGEQYIEVKFKNNRNETIKKRLQTSNDCIADLTDPHLHQCSLHPTELKPSLSNRFTRITLVNKKKTERVTIDFDLAFHDIRNHKYLHQHELCIIELKKDKGETNKGFSEILFSSKITPMGFSKYCIGLALLNNDLKSNFFKFRIYQLKKITNNGTLWNRYI